MRFETTARKSPGWGVNQDCIASARILEDRAEAEAYAADLVTQMRSDGAISAIRDVRVRAWPKGTELSDAPVLFSASYFDSDQRLTDDERYAARVHDWHVIPDRANAKFERGLAEYGFGYQEWTLEWGPKPIECVACGAQLL